MKDLITIWRGLVRRTYSAVNVDRPEDGSRDRERNVVCSTVFERKYRLVTVAFIAAFALLTGLSIIFFHPYDVLFKWKNVFGDKGEIFELWRTPPVDLYLRVHLFNVTNAEAFMNGEDDKLKVEEVGPYVYKELLTHENVTFNDNGTLTMVPKHPLVWVPEMSGGRREDDILYLPNIALLSIADVVKDASYFTKLGLNLVIRQTDSHPLVQMTAREFMFGYNSPLMKLGNTFMPGWIYFDKLGLIDRMYDFDGDFATIYTGEHDLTKSGLIDTYRGETKIPQWEEPCGTIKYASDGTKFPGEIKENDTLLFFRKSMCRAKPLVKVGDTVSQGFSSYVFTFPNNTDDNGRENPNNTCFCNDKSNCLPKGLLDVRGCYYGFPIALSYPHWYQAEPWLTEQVEGSHPSRDKHESFVVIEPKSGLPVELAIRYQINMALGNLDGVANVERFSNLVLPLLWTETRLYGLPTGLVLRFYFYINLLPVVEQVFLYSSFALAFLCLALAVYKCLAKKTTEKEVRWIDEEMAYIDRKLSSYVPEKRSSLSTKELEVYMSSLVTPLNQELTFHEFQQMKEEEV